MSTSWEDIETEVNAKNSSIPIGQSLQTKSSPRLQHVRSTRKPFSIGEAFTKIQFPASNRSELPTYPIDKPFKFNFESFPELPQVSSTVSKVDHVKPVIQEGSKKDEIMKKESLSEHSKSKKEEKENISSIDIKSKGAKNDNPAIVVKKESNDKLNFLHKRQNIMSSLKNSTLEKRFKSDFLSLVTGLDNLSGDESEEEAKELNLMIDNVNKMMDGVNLARKEYMEKRSLKEMENQSYLLIDSINKLRGNARTKEIDRVNAIVEKITQARDDYMETRSRLIEKK